MIVVMTTREHRYTHKRLETDFPVPITTLGYEDMPPPGEAERATYVFTDFDRLPPHHLYKVGVYYNDLRARGFKTFNNPARSVSRFGLLRSLKLRGINDFNAYRVEEFRRPQRWPVFLRMEGHHGPPVSELLHDWRQVQVAVQKSIALGIPISALLIVEYAAEELLPGLFRKLSVFRVGPTLLGYTCVHDDQWMVKHGKPGIAPPELYEDEFRIVRDNPWGEMMLAVFEQAGVEYGRADFGLVGGRPQIYEINTNPDIELGPTDKTREERRETVTLYRQNFTEALRRIDTV
jgi:hypothetical protein